MTSRHHRDDARGGCEAGTRGKAPSARSRSIRTPRTSSGSRAARADIG